MNTLIKYFFRGLLLVIPIGLTIYILVAAVRWLDSLLSLKYPGSGILIILVSITAIGYIGSTLIAKPIVEFFEKLLNRLPLVRIIYSSVKDLISAFVGDKKKFSQPVLVTINKGSDLQKLGFITQEDLSTIGIKEKIAVYLPHSYNFSGDLYIVPKENVVLIQNSGADIMKFIVSGGVTSVSIAQVDNSTHEEI
ncbi:DUF502 domain-containing protein [Rhodocytophaga aerolata]|uniref:DUF502 domain-containing protein n=1 Tax=Rhodocytophaga aerolata TaxID=455078 RepID=A0ABT8RDB5_9BACT|nr:DUF502 domain-containing protein [Rhodocytophaga aerolata]MDO1450080.1 DUF502 domain-containing protein [Rhodocytophaga aerolata]